MYEGTKIVGYQSVRTRPQRDEIERAEALYRAMREGHRPLAMRPGLRRIQQMLQFKFWQKLAAIALVAVGLLVAAFAFHESAVRQLARDMLASLEQGDTLVQAGNLMTTIDGLREQLQQAAARGQSLPAARLQQARATIEQALAGLAEEEGTPGQTRPRAWFRTLAQHYVEQVLAIPAGNSDAAASASRVALEASLYPALVRSYRTLVQSVAGQWQERAGRGVAVGTGKAVLTLLLGVAGLALLLAGGGLVVGRGLGQLRALSLHLQHIATGDLRHRVPHSGSDEFGQLALAIRIMQANLQTIFERFTTSATRVTAADQMLDYSEVARTAMDRQQRETEQVASAMEEMVASVQEVADNTSAAAEAATRAEEEARQGKAVVVEARQSIERLAGEVSRSANVIEALEAKGNSISNIMQVIREIAEQTNLLALNAAIEAARAGEQGRGFAVVADEVRTLAKRTQDATVEISDVIGELQSGIGEAVGVMEGGRGLADAVVAEAGRAAQSLDAIARNVTHIREANTEMARAAGEQSRVAGEMGHNVNAISDLARETNEMMRKASAAGGDLAAVAAALREQIVRFDAAAGGGFDFSRAKAAHLAWKDRIRAYLDGDDQAISRQQAVSHRHCVLGKWYYAEGLEKFGDIPEMRALEAPHERLHAVIHSILDAKESGRMTEAEQLYREVGELSRQIVGLLDLVERKVRVRG